MPIEADELFSTMAEAGRTLVGDVWGQIENFALPELQKIALQIVNIAENITDYTEESARIMFEMQVRASIGIIVAMTELTMLAVQNAINAILGAIRNTVNAALPFPLL